MTLHPSVRRPLRLVLVLAAVGCLAVLLEQGRHPEPAVVPLLRLTADEVVGIRVQMGTRRLQAERVGEAWRVVVPSNPQPGAADAVATLVERIVSLVPVDSFERVDVERRALGLEAGRARIALDTRDRTDAAVIVLGDPVPTGGSVYATLDSDPRIFLLGALVISDLDAAFYHVSQGATS